MDPAIESRRSPYCINVEHAKNQHAETEERQQGNTRAESSPAFDVRNSPAVNASSATRSA